MVKFLPVGQTRVDTVFIPLSGTGVPLALNIGAQDLSIPHLGLEPQVFVGTVSASVVDEIDVDLTVSPGSIDSSFIPSVPSGVGEHAIGAIGDEITHIAGTVSGIPSMGNLALDLPSTVDLTPNVLVGTSSLAHDQVVESGSGQHALGVQDTSVDPSISSGTPVRDLGAQDMTVTVSGNIVADKENGGGNWSVGFSPDAFDNTGNAVGVNAYNDDEASIYTSVNTVPDSHDANIAFGRFGGSSGTPATPPDGFTRTKVELKIRYRWDNTVPVGSSANLTVKVLDSITELATVKQAGTGNSQATLTDEVFDVTSLVDGWADNKITSNGNDGLRLLVLHDCNLLTAGDAGCWVAGVIIILTFERGEIT